MVNSIDKGKGFEREIAHLLSVITKSPWHRVPNSGGLLTSYPDNSHVFQGDIYTNDEKYKNIVIECKFYKKLSINDLFNNKSKIHNAIKQAENESGNLSWMLFIKSNNQGILLIIPDFIDKDYTQVSNILSMMKLSGLILSFKGYSMWKIIK